MRSRIKFHLFVLLLAGNHLMSGAQPNPGGVTGGQKLWFKADLGLVMAGTNVSQWNNQFTGASAITSVSSVTGNPQYITGSSGSAFNYNPVLSFNGTNQYLTTTSDVDFNEIGLHNNTNFGVESFVVVHGSNTGFFWGWQPYNTSPAGNKTGAEAWNCHMVGDVTGNSSIGFAPAVSNTSPLIAGFSGSDGLAIISYYNQLANSGGIVSGFNTSYPTSKFVIGGFDFASGGPSYLLNGRLAEVITYNRQLTAVERNKINTYLAIKYGITLGLNSASGGTRTNYQSPANFLIWISASPGDPMYDFHNDVAGIGRDNSELLNQKQSVSQNVSNPFHVAMGLGTIAVENAANPNNLTDSTYLLWGHNGADALNFNIQVANCTSRFKRLWRVQETGTVDSVTVRIPASALNLGPGETGYMAVSNDTIINSSDQFIQIVPNGPFLECKYNFQTLDFFTFAKSGLPPVIIVTGDTVCKGDTAMLTVSGGTNYQWSTGQNTAVISVTPAQTSTYHVTVSTVNGCADSANVTVVVNPIPALTITPDTAICEGKSLNITAGGGGNYLWSQGQTTPQISVTPDSTTTYSVTVSLASGCKSDTAMTVSINLLPSVVFAHFPDPSAGCLPLSVQFSDSSAPVNQTYAWHFGDGDSSQQQNPSHTYLTAGIYDVNFSITSAAGCVASITAADLVNVYAIPQAAFTSAPPSPVPLSQGVVQFNSSNSSPDAYGWRWNFGDPATNSDTSNLQNPQYVYTQPGNYTVWLHITTIHGCTDSISMNLVVEPDSLVIPNVITPNGDGINDYFDVKNLENYSYNQLMVFNRWGKMIYKREPYIPSKDRWDGKGFADGTYFFILKYKGFLKEGQYRGSLTILR